MYAAYMAAQPATRRFPFGFARFEVLSGFANAIFLVFVGLSIVLESVERMYVIRRPLHALFCSLLRPRVSSTMERRISPHANAKLVPMHGCVPSRADGVNPHF